MSSVIGKIEDLLQRISKSPWEARNDSGILKIVSAPQQSDPVAQFTTCPDDINNVYSFNKAIDNMDFIILIRNAFPEIKSVIDAALLIHRTGFGEENKVNLDQAVSKLEAFNAHESEE